MSESGGKNSTLILLLYALAADIADNFVDLDWMLVIDGAVQKHCALSGRGDGRRPTRAPLL